MPYILLGLIVATGVSAFFLFYLLAINKIFFSFVKEGEIEFSVLGETLHNIMPNLRGYELKKAEIKVSVKNENGEIISPEPIWADRFFSLPKGKETRKKFLGLYWIGFPPYCKILEYTFIWDRLITEANEEEEKKKGRTAEHTGIGDLWVSHRSEQVNSLYSRYTYPIIVKGVELAGRITIDIAFNVTIETVVPIIPIFLLKGRWFLPFTAEFKGVISDILRGMELVAFEKMDKGTKFNLAVAERNESLISTTGMKSFKTNYIAYAISGSDDEKKAATAEKLAELNANATIKTSVGTKESTIEIATGEAEATNLKTVADVNRLNQLLLTASKYEGGIEILERQIFTEGLTNTGVNVLSLGQGGNPIQFTVGTEGENKKKIKKKIDRTVNDDESDRKGEK